MTKVPTDLKTRRSGFQLLVGVALLMTGVCCSNQLTKKGTETVSSKLLPPADIKSSPLLQILQKRHTSREYASKVPDQQTVSNLLWAAYGVSRPDGKRTAPSAHDWQYIDIYVTDSVGLYRFNAKQHDLELVKPGDIRTQTGEGTAPISLVFVSDERKFAPDTSAELKTLYGAATTGAIVQNTYLFCAANDMNTGVRADIDRPVLHQTMGLSIEQKILLAQSVGYAPTVSRLKTQIKSLLARK